MKVAALADLHLGFRQFDRVASNGVNQREIDVALTFRRVIDSVIREHPDVVTVAGDVFHHSRPSNSAINFAMQEFGRLRRALPDAVILIAAGNHDSPRTTDAGNILKLFEHFGAIVATSEPVSGVIGDLEYMVVPDLVGVERPTLAPSRGSKYRLLVLHGEIAGMLPVSTPNDIEAATLSDEWDYIALGHWHVYREVKANAFYSGSVDYTSSDPWGEVLEAGRRGVPGKGYVIHDLATGVNRFVPVEVSRHYIDLPHIDCSGLSPSDIDDAMAENWREHGGEDQVYRQLLLDCHRYVVKDLNQANLKKYRATALHYQLDTRRPEASVSKLTDLAESTRLTLRDVVNAYLQGRELPPDIDRERFVALGMRYFDAQQTTQANIDTLQEAAA